MNYQWVLLFDAVAIVGLLLLLLLPCSQED